MRSYVGFTLLAAEQECVVELLCIQGNAPGQIVATLSHAAEIRQVPMVVARHPAGGWHIALAEGGYGPRCRSVATAILMEASEVFDGDIETRQTAQAA
jgi:hypothetical protein